MHNRWLVVAAVLLLVACGDKNNDNKDPGTDMGGNNTPDMPTPEDMSNNNNNNLPDMVVTPDMPDPQDMPNPTDMPADAGDVGMDVSTDMADMPDVDMGTGPCTHNRFTPSMEMVVYDDDINLRSFVYTSFHRTMGNPLYGFLSFEVYPDFGGTIGAQNFTFTGENYDSCGTCLLAFWCDANAAVECDQAYLIQSGSVEVTAGGLNAGDPYTATFTDLVFAEVTIDQATFTTTPVPNGDTWCVDSITATGTTTLAP